MRYSQTQSAALALLRTRLDPSRPMYAGSAEVTAALSGPARLYFSTWILPVLDYLTDGEQWHGQADELKREHASRAAAAQARKAWEQSDAERGARAAAGLRAIADSVASFEPEAAPSQAYQGAAPWHGIGAKSEPEDSARSLQRSPVVSLSAPIDPAHEGRAFACHWTNPNGSASVGAGYFTDARGFDDADRAAILALDIGASWQGDCLTVYRNA
jgi:hypothetical protein